MILLHKWNGLGFMCSGARRRSPFHQNIYRLWSKDVHNHEECPLQDTQTPSVCAAPINSVILAPQNGDEYPLGSNESVNKSKRAHLSSFALHEA